MPASSSMPLPTRPERLTPAQDRRLVALAKVRPGTRVVGTDDGDPVLATPKGFKIALTREGRWRIVSWPPGPKDPS